MCLCKNEEEMVIFTYHIVKLELCESRGMEPIKFGIIKEDGKNLLETGDKQEMRGINLIG